MTVSGKMIFGGSDMAGPGGASGSIQYNNSGSFGGFGNWNGTIATLPALTVTNNALVSGTLTVTGHVTLEGVTSTGATGTGLLVFGNTPTLIAPILGTPTSGTLTNCTLPIGGVTGLGTGVATFLATPSSANLAAAVTDETGSGALVFATSPTFVTPILGTPTSGTLTNCTLPVGGITGLGTGVATILAATPTGTGSLVAATTPTLVTPVLGVATGTSLLLSGGLGRGAGAFEYTLDWRPTTGATAGKTAIFQDLTATTGKTTVVLKGGAVSGNNLESRDSSNALFVFLTDDGVVGSVSNRIYAPSHMNDINYRQVGVQGTDSANYYLIMGSTGRLGFTSGNGMGSDGANLNNLDSMFSRISAGLIGVGTGAQGSFAGGLKLSQILVAADTAGVASTTSFSNATDTTTTNAYTVKGGQVATTANTGWIKIYVGTTVAWVPYWANATP